MQRIERNTRGITRPHLMSGLENQLFHTPD